MALNHRGVDAHTNFHYRYYLWPDGRVRDAPLEAELRQHYGLAKDELTMASLANMSDEDFQMRQVEA